MAITLRSISATIATKATIMALLLLFVVASSAAPEIEEKQTTILRNFHKRHIPHRPDRPSIREQVTQKHMNRRYHLERHLTELQSIITNHESGRKLLSTEEEYHRHLKFVHGLQRKLAMLTTTTTTNNNEQKKDPKMEALVIEEEIRLQERMLVGEFLWDMENGELVLKEENEKMND